MDLPLAHSINIKGHYNVTIEENSKYKRTLVTVQGDPENINHLVVEAQGKNIEIYYPDDKKRNESIPLVIHIQTNGLNTLSFAGDNSVSVSGIKTNSFTVATKGNNHITLAGRVNSFHLTTSGNSKVMGEELFSEDAQIHSRGNSDITVRTKNTLERHVFGNTQLKIKGRPKVTGDVRGSVKIKHID